MAGRPQQRQPADAAARCRQVGRQDRTKGKGRQPDFLAGADQAVNVLTQGLHQPLQAGWRSQFLRFAAPGQIGQPHRVMTGQRIDVAHPVQPAAIAAMHQNQGRTAADAAPADAGFLKPRLQFLAALFNPGDQRPGLLLAHGDCHDCVNPD